MLFDRGGTTNIYIMLEEVCTCGHIREKGMVFVNQLNDARPVLRFQIREVDIQVRKDF